MTQGDRAEWVENRAPQSRFPSLRLGELWRSRELTYFFFLRDVRARYKQTVLGVLWVLLGPISGALSFTFLFNVLAGVETEGSYFALALTGFVTWNFVSGVMSGAAASLLEHEDLITHVSFPMIAAPMSVVLVGFADLAVGVVLALVVAAVTGGIPSLVGLVVGLPIGALLMALTGLGPGLYFAPAQVKYRDSAAVLGLATQVLFFLGPVAYPPELIGQRFQDLLYLNPVTGCVALMRWALTSAPAPQFLQLFVSFAVASAMALVGLVSFRRNERQLVDVI